MIISFNLNHQQVYIDTNYEKSLAAVLRENFSLLTTHNCCHTGRCGSCLVLWNSKIVNSCLIPMGLIPFTDVITLEGFARTPILESIKHILKQFDITLCPYCSAPRTLSIISLLQNHAKITPQAISDTLEMLYCPCTNYESLKKCLLQLTLIKGNYE